MSSDVAQLRRAIEEEHRAAQRALHEVALVGSHDMIQARMQRICDHWQDLKALVGPQQAIMIVAEVMEGVPRDEHRALQDRAREQGEEQT